jgi:predicted P-loop ATPase
VSQTSDNVFPFRLQGVSPLPPGPPNCVNDHRFPLPDSVGSDLPEPERSWFREFLLCRNPARGRQLSILLNREADKRERAAAAKNAAPNKDEEPKRNDWFDLMIMDKKKHTMPILTNVANALRHAPQFACVFAFDEFFQDIALTGTLPTAPGAPRRNIMNLPRLMGDNDVSQVQEWLQHNGLLTIGRNTVHQAIALVASENPFHPVCDWLDSLVWDGTERMSDWLTDCLGVAASEYASAVGRMFLIQMVARVFNPGCKADYTLILEGGQGSVKSQACRILASDDWFSDQMPDIRTKDACQHLRGKWLIEIGELSAFGAAESEALKAFLTRQIEKYRPPYGHEDVIEPRQCVFIGTTNLSLYLKDPTGGRRFWPVSCGVVQLARLVASRDQLFAEAVDRYRHGEHWWPDADFEIEHIEPEQRSRRDKDAWHGNVVDYLDGKSSAYVADIARVGLGIETRFIKREDQHRIRDVLVDLNWKPATKHTKKGTRWLPSGVLEGDKGDDEG